MQERYPVPYSRITVPDTIIIHNPAAGHRNRLSDVEEVRDMLKGHGGRVELAVTSKTGDVTDTAEITRQALVGRFKKFVIAGGDGHIREVAAVIAHTDGIMAILPIGSENVIARAARISSNLTAAGNTVLYGDVHLIDTGLIDGERFVANAGIGVHADIFHGVQPFGKPKDGTGIVRYAKEAIDKLPRHRGSPALVIVDGEETFSDHLSEIIALNFPTLPIINRITNRRVLDGHVDDGYLDCFVATAEKPSDLVFPAVATAITKRGNNTCRIVTCESIIVDFRTGKPVNAQADGDSLPGRTRHEIQDDPASLLLQVPYGENTIYQEPAVAA